MTLAQVRSTTLTFKELGKSYGRAAESQQYLPVAIDKLVQNKGHGLGFIQSRKSRDAPRLERELGEEAEGGSQSPPS